MKSPAHSRAFFFVLKPCEVRLATRSFAISVPICENAVAIWLGCVSMKKSFALLAQAGSTAD